jgi:DNA end-binding protein Ku
MGDKQRVALGRFVLRTKEYLVAVRVRDGVLALTTMRFADEIRSTKELDRGGGKPAKAQLDQAVRLIEALTVDWEPEAYEDRYRQRLLALVRRKEKGQTIKAPEQAPEPAPTADLMAALRQTLDELSRPERDGGAKGPRKPAQADRDGALSRKR